MMYFLISVQYYILIIFGIVGYKKCVIQFNSHINITDKSKINPMLGLYKL